MLDLWTGFCLAVLDFLLGWLLYLPADVVLFAVAIGSALILTGVRKFTTDQDWLRRAADDRKRLGQLVKEAKKKGDREAVQRCRATQAEIGLKALKAEGKPLLAAVIPIAMLATWCLDRLDFHPPQPAEPVTLALYAPATAAGDLVHLVPQPGLQAADGWVRKLSAVTDDGPPHSLATWSLTGQSNGKPYPLLIRHGQRTYEADLRVGGRTYSLPLKDHGNEVISELQMRPLKLFGIVPGIPAIFFPPWLVAYLVIVIPFVFVVKRVLKIH